MDSNRRKELIEQYKNRLPEMGVISFRCKATGESFLGISNDTKADFNGNIFQLSSGLHANKHLQSLWDQYGQDGFECKVIQVLKYDDPQKDHTEDLEKLRQTCLARDPKAVKLWK